MEYLAGKVERRASNSPSRRCWMALAAAAFLVAAPAVCAAGATFVAIASGNWNNPAIWSITTGADADGIPDANDKVTIPAGFTVTVDSAVSSADLTVKGAGAALNVIAGGDLTVEAKLKLEKGAAFNISGGSVTANDKFDIKDGATSFTMTGGSLTTKKPLTVDKGAAFNVSGGALTANDVFDIKGGSTVTLSGGTLTADNKLNIKDASSSFSMTGGTLVTNNDLTADKGAALSILGGTATANGKFDVKKNSTFTLGGGALTTKKKLTVDSSTFAFSGGTFAANDKIDIKKGGTATVADGLTIAMNGQDLSVKDPGSSLTLSGSASITDAKSLKIDKGGAVTLGATSVVSVRKSVDVKDGTLTANAGSDFSTNFATFKSSDGTGFDFLVGPFAAGPPVKQGVVDLKYVQFDGLGSAGSPGFDIQDGASVTADHVWFKSGLGPTYVTVESTSGTVTLDHLAFTRSTVTQAIEFTGGGNATLSIPNYVSDLAAIPENTNWIGPKTGNTTQTGPADVLPFVSFGGSTGSVQWGTPTPLPVQVDRFTAKVHAGGAWVRWHAASEVRNLGFNLWREPLRESNPHSELRTPPSEGWVRVNRVLIGGRMTNPSPKSYRWWDPVAPGTYRYRLESVSIDGEREFYTQTTKPVTVEPDTETRGPVHLEALEAVMDAVERAQADWQYRRMARSFSETPPRGAPVRITPVMSRAKKASTAEATPLAAARIEPRRLASTQAKSQEPGAGSQELNAVQARGAGRTYNAAKAVTQGSGVLRIPQALLPAGFDVRHVTIVRGGRPVRALALPGGAVLLYAPGYEDAYTDRDAYFLRARRGRTPAGTVRRARGLFNPGRVAVTSAPETAALRFQKIYFDWTQRPLTYTPWFSDKFLTGGSAHLFSLDTPWVVPGQGAALRVTLWSFSPPATPANPLPGSGHALRVSINGTDLPEARWNSEGALTLRLEVPAGVLVDGPNNIVLATPDIPANPGQLSFLYAVEMDYTKTLDGSTPLAVRPGGGSGAQLFEVRGLPGAEAWVVNARRPEHARLAPYETRAEPDGTFTVRFWGWPGGDGYRVVPRGQELAPLSVSARTIRFLPGGIRYLAVGPKPFEAPLQPLLAARSAEGLRARFADQEELFDAYGFGRFGPLGIRRAVRRAHPRFLLLAGKTIWDYKNHEGFGLDPLCPTFFYSASQFSQTASDALFGNFGGGFPRIAVGRFPARTVAELQAAVANTLQHTGSASPSGLLGLLAADRIDPNAGDFHASADALALATAAHYAWTKAYLGVDPNNAAADLTQALQTAANGGADVIVWVGHGSSSVLSKESVLTPTEAANWSGNAVFLQATCSANYFMHNIPGFYTNAQRMFANGGISASIASTTFASTGPLADFTRMVLKAAARRRGRRPLRWGQALLRAQRRAFQAARAARTRAPRRSAALGDLVWTECLLGDPALPVYAPAPGARTRASSTSKREQAPALQSASSGGAGEKF